MTATNLREAEEFLAGMVGKRCWRVRDTYGEQIVLDIGGRRRPKSRVVGEYGEWYVGSLYSEWSAVQTSDRAILATFSDPIRKAVAALKVLEHARVEAAAVTESLTLQLRFSNGIELRYAPPGSMRDVEYWEVFGPEHRMLTGGPGARCGVRRSDVPLRDRNEPG